MKSRHTFAIPAYGASSYLEECVRALRAQTVSSEIIIATSTPSAFIDTIAKKYHIPVIVNRTQKGIASDWNFACRCCRTDYLTLAHQDDIYLPDYTEKGIEAMAKKNDSLIVFTDYNEVFDGQVRTDTLLLSVKRLILLPFFWFKPHITAPLFKKAILSAGSAICCPSVMFNKQAIGEIEFNHQMSINMDWHFWLKLAETNGSFHYIREKLMLHRIHADSETSKGLLSNRRQMEDRYMFGRIWPAPFADIMAKIYSLSYISNDR